METVKTTLEVSVELGVGDALATGAMNTINQVNETLNTSEMIPTPDHDPLRSALVSWYMATTVNTTSSRAGDGE